MKATKNVRSYEKGTKGLRNKLPRYEKGMKLRKRYVVTKKVRSYEKGTKGLQRWYELTKKVRSYEKGAKGLRRGYEISYQVLKKVRSYEKGTKRLQNKLQKALVTKLPSYEIITPPIGIICYDL